MQTSITYFHRVSQETPTRLWINNATPEQAEAARAAGAVGATTNPTYPSKLMKEAPDYFHSLVDGALEKTDDDDQAAAIIYQEAVSRLQAIFLPLHKESQGREGYVAIQGDPRVNTDFDAIIKGALNYHRMGENIIVKVPATPVGAAAMEELTAMGHPTIATMGFSVDQAVYMAEAYRRGLKRTKSRPICYVTFIAGILEDYLKKESERRGYSVRHDVIEQASCVGHRVAYRIFKERGYEAVLLGGGARGAHHFTELVGGDTAITIGWSLADQLVRADGPIISRIDASAPEEMLSELEKHFPDFTKSCRENAMSPEQFHEYGPVVMFQNAFLAGIDMLLRAIGVCKTNRDVR